MLYHAPEAWMGPLNLEQAETVLCHDLKMLSMVVGKRIDGILGMNFLKRYIVRIDFDNGKLILLDPKTLPSPSWGEPTVIRWARPGWFVVQTRILDRETTMLIDTGYDKVMLQRKLFDYVRGAQGGKTATSLVETMSGTVNSQMIRLQHMTVGSRKYSDVIIGEGSSNILGLGFLARHVVTLDFPRGRMYLKKGKHFDRVDEADMSGLHLLKVGGKVVVHSVDKDSPAQKAQIEAHDIILTVNAQSAAAMDIFALRNLLRSGDKNKIDMTIEHGHAKKTVSFLLKKIL
jgi:predicted aspartyl protease